MLELAAFGLLCFALAAVGGLAGLVLGNVRLPASVSIAGSFAAGGGANVAISGVAAATAAVKHIRDGRVNWRMWWWLAPPSLIGGFLGGYLATVVSGDLLSALVAAVLFYGGWELVRWQLPADRAQGREDEGPITMQSTRDRAVTLAIGLVVGVLGGAVGLILGSLRMPALLKFTAESPQRLVGTNLSAGVLVGIAGAAGHLTSGSAAFDWQLFAVGAVCSPPGAWLGAQLTGRLPTQTLVRTIGAIVFLAALVMALQVAL